MKKKIGTMLDEELIFKAKQAALSEHQALSHLLTNALKMYLRSLEKKKTWCKTTSVPPRAAQ